MSANTIRHRSSDNYDIDAFIKQLLESQKFDELADKVADKAANAIKNMEKPPLARLERFSDANEPYKNVTLQKYRENSNREYDETKVHKKKDLRNNHETTQRGHRDVGKINTLAFMKKDTSSQSDDLRLKYKYLTRNAYEKKVLTDRISDVDRKPDTVDRTSADVDRTSANVDRTSANVDRTSVNVDRKLETVDRNPILRNFDKNEGTSKQNVKQQSKEEVREHYEYNTESQVSVTYVTEKSKHSPKNEEEADAPSRHITRDNNRDYTDSDRNNNKMTYIPENAHSDNEEVIHEENTKIKEHNYRDEPRARYEPEHPQHSRDAHNRKPEFKSIAKAVSKHTEKDEENPASVDKDNEENPENEERSIEKSYDREFGPKEAERNANDENVEEEEAAGRIFRAHDDDSFHEVEENKVAPTDYISNEYSEDTDSQETTKLPKKPIVRKEGNKLFTFVEAPEYEEYHEEVARIKKENEGKEVLSAF